MAVIESDNNTAELKAISFALKSLPKIASPIVIISDSQYAIQCIRTNSCRWHEKETLKEINNTLSNYAWSCFWIKGHQTENSHICNFNRQVDNMASSARRLCVIIKKKLICLNPLKLRNISKEYQKD